MKNPMFNVPLNTNKLQKVELKDMPDWFTPALDFINKIAETVYYAQEFDLKKFLNSSQNTETKHVLFYEKFDSGVDGSNFNSGSWEPRQLNTIDYNSLGDVSLSNDFKFSVPSGLYLIFGEAGTDGNVGTHKTRLYKTNGGTTLAVGTSGRTTSGDDRSFIFKIQQINKEDILQYQHQCSNSSSNGFGLASGFGEPEIYSNLYLRSIK
jgi:hypothetical protein